VGLRTIKITHIGIAMTYPPITQCWSWHRLNSSQLSLKKLLALGLN